MVKYYEREISEYDKKSIMGHGATKSPVILVNWEASEPESKLSDVN